MPTQHAGQLGSPRRHNAHAGGSHGHGAPHESPWVMVVPLMILAFFSLVGGWVGVPIRCTDPIASARSFRRCSTKLQQRPRAESLAPAEGSPSRKTPARSWRSASSHSQYRRAARLRHRLVALLQAARAARKNRQGRRRSVYARPRTSTGSTNSMARSSSSR